jgi:hypothetical protein
MPSLAASFIADIAMKKISNDDFFNIPVVIVDLNSRVQKNKKKV